MIIHVYSTLAYVKVGRKERQPRQTRHTKPQACMYMYTSNKLYNGKRRLVDTCMYMYLDIVALRLGFISFSYC